jgi:hypothetical protein
MAGRKLKRRTVNGQSAVFVTVRHATFAFLCLFSPFIVEGFAMAVPFAILVTKYGEPDTDGFLLFITILLLLGFYIAFGALGPCFRQR